MTRGNRRVEMKNNLMIMILCPAILLGQGIPATNWVIKKESNVLTRCRTKAIGICEQGKIEVEIELTHVAGANEAFGLNIIVPSFSKYSFIDWNQFDPWESPHKKKILIIKPKNSTKGYRSPAEGRFPDSNTFMFDNTTSNLKKDPLYAILHEAKDSNEEWVVLVVNKKASKPIMTIPFTFSGARDYLRSYLQ